MSQRDPEIHDEQNAIGTVHGGCIALLLDE